MMMSRDRFSVENDEEEAEEEAGMPRPRPGADGKIQFIGQGPAVPFGQNSMAGLLSQLPTTGEGFNGEGFDDADEDRVLTQEELRAQTELRLAAKEELQLRGREGKGKRKNKKRFE
eukprot:TRINITY_DN2851_c0_g1_i1.p1 TRINITY_DN2851_c0_g1~~TRINITY_DN2851_c0_g1_i1.p1  ORF type:complete len:116 (-),score=50.36 TRINITY_DN2851_c0_g1_i1:127-474(-)